MSAFWDLVHGDLENNNSVARKRGGSKPLGNHNIDYDSWNFGVLFMFDLTGPTSLHA